MIICADDFGMAENINEAVLELLDQGKVTAVSCAVSHPSCRAVSLSQLMERSTKADIGLHLVLTQDSQSAGSTLSPLTTNGRFQSFRTLLRCSWMRQLKVPAVKREIESQYRRFHELAGQPPNFVDGHLHVHQFPIISDALLEFVSELPPSQQPYIRNTCIGMPQIFRFWTNLPKNLVIGIPGTAFRRRVLGCGLATNTGFAGVYNYWPRINFRRLFEFFVSNLSAPNDLLMIHPGLEEAWRRNEYEALRSWDPPAGALNRFLKSEAVTIAQSPGQANFFHAEPEK